MSNPTVSANKAVHITVYITTDVAFGQIQ